MDRTTLVDNLSTTRRQIEQVKTLITRQRCVLAEAIIERRNARSARETLVTMEDFLSLVASRNELEQKLAEHPLGRYRVVNKRHRS